MSEDDFSLPLKYQLLLSTPETLSGFLDVSEALANRIHRRLSEYTGYRQFAELLKTRETTRTRINRSLLHILLRLERESDPLPCLRILGFRKSSAPLLNYLKRHTELPLFRVCRHFPGTRSGRIFSHPICTTPPSPAKPGFPVPMSGAFLW